MAIAGSVPRVGLGRPAYAPPPARRHCCQLSHALGHHLSSRGRFARLLRTPSASITGVVFRPPARRIRWLQVRSARTACRPNRICPCRGIARALCVCRELAQVQLLRLRLHQPPARPSSRPQVRTARNMCRSARTHTMRWRCTRSLTACHRVWPVLCAHCAGVQQDALARNDLSLTEGRPRVGVEMTNAHARAPTRAQLLNRVNPSTCERAARKNGSLSSLLAACRTVAIFARPR